MLIKRRIFRFVTRLIWIKRMNRVLGLSLLILYICFESGLAQSTKLPREVENTLQKKFESWKMAEVDEAISEYFKRTRPFESPNLINGDWDGDGRTDFAALLQRKTDPEKKIILVVMNKRNGFQNYFLEGFDCLMSIKKGETEYDFEAKKNFKHKNDAIFSYIWEKAGTSYVWEKNRFRSILTSD